MALPSDGKLITCDVSPEWTSIAQRYWVKAGVAAKIDLRIGPAAKTLEQLAVEFGRNSFDFAFIDADKTAYDLYYEACVKLVRSGGVIALDNVLRGGDVVNKRKRDTGTIAMRALNEKIRDDSRVSAVLLTLGDGVTVVRKL
jgi:predicted O-methyltransferase YrrM